MISCRSGKSLATVGGEQARDRNRLLEDEVKAVVLARRGAAAGRVDERRDTELAQRLVDRIPVAIAERGQRRTLTLHRVGVEQHADAPELLDRAPHLPGPVARLGRRALGQPRHPGEAIGEELAAASNQVVGLLGEPLNDPGRLLAVHHLVRPRRDELQVDAGAVEVLQVGNAERSDLLGDRGPELIVGDPHPAPAVRAAVCEQVGLVRVQALGRAHMPMNIDDHRVLRFMRVTNELTLTETSAAPAG